MEPRIRLRVTGTSDLHAYNYPHDYYRDQVDATVGLGKTATLIGAARVEAPNTVVFDNGDVAARAAQRLPGPVGVGRSERGSPLDRRDERTPLPVARRSGQHIGGNCPPDGRSTPSDVGAPPKRGTLDACAFSRRAERAWRYSSLSRCASGIGRPRRGGLDPGIKRRHAFAGAGRDE